MIRYLSIRLTIAGSLLLSTLLFAAPKEEINECGERLKGLRFYQELGDKRVSSQRVVDGKSVPTGETRALRFLDEDYPYLLALYARHPERRQRLLEFLGNPKRAAEIKLPFALKVRLKQMGNQSRSQLIREILEDHHSIRLMSLPVPPFLKPRAINALFSSHAAFFDTSKKVESLQLKDGRIDIPRLLEVKELVDTYGAIREPQILRDTVLNPSEVKALPYVIQRNPTGKARMRIGVIFAEADNPDEQQIHHDEVARNRPVEFAGHVALTESGKIRGITLESGHFMEARQKEIDSFINRISRSRADRKRLRRAAAQRDHDFLNSIVTRELGIPIAQPGLILVRSHQFQGSDYEALMDHPIRADKE